MGACLAQQGRFAEAEPLLLEGYKGLVAPETSFWEIFRASRTTRAAERLVSLYEEWGKLEQAAKWRLELARIEELYAEPVAAP